MAESAKLLYMTVEEYLTAEESSQFKHEYLAGQVFAMSGATDAHNRICGNLYVILHAHLRGTSCAVYMNDMKVRIDSSNSFYYPDLMVTCEPYVAESVFKYAPVLIVEVLSKSTQATDRREKLIAYKQIASLQNYIIVYQNRPKIEVYSREAHGHWQLNVLRQHDELEIESLAGRKLKLPIIQVYEDCNPPPPIVAESEASYDEDY